MDGKRLIQIEVLQNHFQNKTLGSADLQIKTAVAACGNHADEPDHRLCDGAGIADF